MYGYFAGMGTKHRRAISRFAIYITLLQMLVGMFVTIKAVLYQIEGEECHVNKTNSLMGLIMYASYFVLFFKLFVDNYFLKSKGVKRQRSVREVVRTVTRQITQTVEVEMEAEAEGAVEASATEIPEKKLN